jgi:hypothetical protein
MNQRRGEGSKRVHQQKLWKIKWKVKRGEEPDKKFKSLKPLLHY